MTDPKTIIARAICTSFYEGGTIYDATVEEVIEARVGEWGPQAEAAISALQAAGLRIVPVEPTATALIAGSEAIDGRLLGVNQLKAVYKAMLEGEEG